MSYHRLFASFDENNEIIFTDADTKHLLKVLNFQIGKKVEVVVNKELYLAEIISVSPSLKAKAVEKINFDPELTSFVRLIYSIPKGDKLDLVVQKATELGVSEIVLLNSERCIAKITKEKKDKKLKRLNEIAKNAAEQSHRLIVPTIELVLDNINELSFYKENNFNYIAYEKEFSSKNNVLIDDLENLNDKIINVLVGPEGGFSEKEVEIANSFNFKNISLGKRILRSETAAIALLSLFNFYLN